MITHSDAYKKLKIEVQDSLDFVVLCCHSVPALNGYMKAVDNNAAPKIPDPDHFDKPIDHNRLKGIAPKYKKVLGGFLLLSSFSYFEAYVKNVFAEMYDFHGGYEKFLETAITRRNENFHSISQDTEKIVKRLRERDKKGKEVKYAKLISQLNTVNYLLPSQLFSAYGIKMLNDQLRSLRAADIPDLLNDALGLVVTDDDKNEFSSIRGLRNSIAHGNSPDVDLGKAINSTKFLHQFAGKIDKHLIQHFFVLEVF